MRKLMNTICKILRTNNYPTLKKRYFLICKKNIKDVIYVVYTYNIVIQFYDLQPPLKYVNIKQLKQQKNEKINFVSLNYWHYHNVCNY
jgi:hypothetical protein